MRVLLVAAAVCFVVASAKSAEKPELPKPKRDLSYDGYGPGGGLGHLQTDYSGLGSIGVNSGVVGATPAVETSGSFLGVGGGLISGGGTSGLGLVSGGTSDHGLVSGATHGVFGGGLIGTPGAVVGDGGGVIGGGGLIGGGYTGGVGFGSVVHTGVKTIGSVHTSYVPVTTLKQVAVPVFHQINTVTKQIPVPVPQPYPVTVNRNVPVPYHVTVPKPYAVPVKVNVPVEIPKPYPVHVTKKIPVPVEVNKPYPVHVIKKIPVPYIVPKPYPVTITRKVAVPYDVPKPYPVTVTNRVPYPVQTPVYVKVPHAVKVGVPQPYVVPVPQPYAVKVPTPVVVKEPHVYNKWYDTRSYPSSYYPYFYGSGLHGYGSNLHGYGSNLYGYGSNLHGYDSSLYGYGNGLYGYGTTPYGYSSGLYGGIYGSKSYIQPAIETGSFIGSEAPIPTPAISVGGVLDAGVVSTSTSGLSGESVHAPVNTFQSQINAANALGGFGTGSTISTGSFDSILGSTPSTATGFESISGDLGASSESSLNGGGVLEGRIGSSTISPLEGGFLKGSLASLSGSFGSSGLSGVAGEISSSTPSAETDSSFQSSYDTPSESAGGVGGVVQGTTEAAPEQ